MKKNYGMNGNVHDFDWIMNYLGIADKNIIAQYKKWNYEEMNQPVEAEYDEDGNKIVKEVEIHNNPLLLYTNKKFRGSHSGHYVPMTNIIELKDAIAEEDPPSHDLLLVAHEFAHSLIYSNHIIGNRAGHGVLFYYRLMKDVIWYANNIKPVDKLRALKEEFSYSCSLGQYRGLNRNFRSQSCTIALMLDYFTIEDLIEDKRSDISELGLWLLQELSVYVANLPNDYAETGEVIESIINQAMRNIDAHVWLAYEPQTKPFRR